MRLRETIDYEAPPHAVLAMLTDRSFRTMVCERTHALDHAVTIDVAGRVTTVSVWRSMPADVPGFFRRLVGDRLEIQQIERWDGPVRADLAVRIVGKPASLDGYVALEQTTAGTRQIVDGRVNVSVPFIGGDIAKEIARAIRAALAVEAETGREYLRAR
ncbi:MAG TPA: DUF2505 domain-containing protein [Euzebyales bacterium]